MACSQEMSDNLRLLDADQRTVIEHIDGPLLVMGGPGTGKTLLLAIRAAHILNSKDIAASNILCLTATKTGTETLRNHLVSLVGPEGRNFAIFTVREFAAEICSRYPRYVRRSAQDCLISELEKRKLYDTLLSNLPKDAPLARRQNGIACHIQDISMFISRLKREGLTANQVRAIASQTKESIAYLSNSEIIHVVSEPLPTTLTQKRAFCESFVNLVGTTCAAAPESLRNPVLYTPGVYVPYLTWFARCIEGRELCDKHGKTSGYQSIKKQFFVCKDGLLTFKDDGIVDSCFMACDIYDAYQEELHRLRLYDTDDVFQDAIYAIEQSHELQEILSHQYHYIQMDDFQEATGAQMRLVELLYGSDKCPNVMAAADEHQALTRFQGAAAESVRQFYDVYHPSSVHLEVNHRSTSALTKLGIGIRNQLDVNSSQKDLPSTIPTIDSQGEKHEFSERVFSSKEAKLVSLAGDIRSRLEQNYEQGHATQLPSISVIAPHRRELTELVPYLIREKIPFSYLKTIDMYAIESMQTLLALIRFCVAYADGNVKSAQLELPRLVAAPEFRISQEERGLFVLRVQQHYAGDWITAFDSVTTGPLNELWEHLIQWSHRASNGPIRSLLFDMAHSSFAYWSSRCDEDPYSFAEFNAGFRCLLSFVDSEVRCLDGDGKHLSLKKIASALEQARRYGVPISAVVPLASKGAVNLITVSHSKGLEFDVVYLLDCDDAAWHDHASGTGLIPENMLSNDNKSDKDASQQLYVAATRAKGTCEFYRCAGVLVQELDGLIGSDEVSVSASTLGQGLEIAWKSSCNLETPQLRDLLVSDVMHSGLSVSALNSIVTFKADSDDSTELSNRHQLPLPHAPQIATEFGTCVHAFLEEYVNHVITGSRQCQDVVSEARSCISRMDFDQEEIDNCLERFQRIVDCFLPVLAQRLVGEAKTETWVKAVIADSIPLVGKLDLLLVDSKKHTVKVIDYKTGFSYPSKTPTPEYARQLQFYRLLIERSTAFKGYKVIGMEDWYVEPELNTGRIHDAVCAFATDDEVQHVSCLIESVWQRSNSGSFTTSAFEQSDGFVQAQGEGQYLETETAKRRLIQRAYEEWLIAENEQRKTTPAKE